MPTTAQSPAAPSAVPAAPAAPARSTAPASARARGTRSPGIWLGLSILYVVWGSTYLGIAVAIETIPPFFMAGARFLLAGLIMLVIAVAVARRLPARPSRREVIDSAIVGALLLGGGMGMVAWGQQTVPSGIAALLVATMPLWIAIFGRAFLGQHLPRLAAIGIVTGFVGIVVLVGPSLTGTGHLDVPGVLAVLFSPISWSLGSLYAANRATLPRDPFVGTGLQMLAGSVVLAIMGLVSGETAELDIGGISTASLVAFAYLTLIGSVLAFTTYGWLLRNAPLPIIATYAYVNPVVAVFLGWLVLGEGITPQTLVAGAIIVFAVALIVTTRGRMAAPHADDEANEDAVRDVEAAPAVVARAGATSSASASGRLEP